MKICTGSRPKRGQLLLFLCISCLMTDLTSSSPLPFPDKNTAHLSLPNRPSGLERFLGLGVVIPYPYFQRPNYRFPVYDAQGRGYLAYGYGGKETFRYTKFDQREGHH